MDIKINTPEKLAPKNASIEALEKQESISYQIARFWSHTLMSSYCLGTANNPKRNYEREIG